ncbi:ACP S-malonyltransferase [Motilibacter deserti]|uniref:[acyl-carrier-protein] S-malonyltransferase n=1 Tax=Motilibacter deserti TaxID=2714956 RepID=A0ABX0GT80_9ACTN|nr:ACP S-malonyltransferase [Motilibacter deserti]
MLAVVAPGQGAQTPGFLSPWLALPGFAGRLAALSQALRERPGAPAPGPDLASYGTEADADTIRDTAVAQPLLVAAGIAALAELVGSDDPAGTGAYDVVAGHSVGELTAAFAAGVLTGEQTMALVGARGDAMAAAASTTRTGMTAVLGGDRDEVLAAVAAAGLTPANDNGGGQLVVGGTLEQLTAFAEAPPARARLVPLQVAGAFHTEHMRPAVDALAPVAAALEPRDARVPLLSNKDGQQVASGREVLTRIVAQVASPVRWDLCTEALRELGITALIELPPAGTLAGLAKRGLRGIEIVALKTPDDLDAARALVREHAKAPGTEGQE